MLDRACVLLIDLFLAICILNMHFYAPNLEKIEGEIAFGSSVRHCPLK